MQTQNLVGTIFKGPPSKGNIQHLIVPPFETGADANQLSSGLSVAPDSARSSTTSDSPSPISVGGWLQLFYHQWDIASTDAWLLRTITTGLTLEFTSTPPNRFLQCPL